MQAGSLMGELVFNYLLHEGRLDSAAAVARDILGDVVQVRAWHSLTNYYHDYYYYFIIFESSLS